MRVAPILMAACGAYAMAQAPATPNKEVLAETGGTPPRSMPTDYQAHAAAGQYTLAADFTAHTITTLQGNLTNEDYVVVEFAAFGPPGAHLTLSPNDFSLHFNGNKKGLTSQPYAFVLAHLKNPDFEATLTQDDDKKKKKSQTSEDLAAPPPPPPVYPPEVRREMAERVRKLQLPLGDRALPQSGFLFFSYGGHPEKLRSIELVYDGPAGKATLAFHP